MRALVRVRLDSGERVELGHGDIIGRLWNAALVVDDPRVSEAHAVISLRGHELKLLGLRGRFAVDGRPVGEIALRRGQRLELAAGLTLEVEEVELPDEVMGLETVGMAPRVLPGTCALVVQPAPGFSAPSDPAAVAHVWCLPEGWRLRPVGGAAVTLLDGMEVVAGGRTWRAVSMSLGGPSNPTRVDASLDVPLRIVARFDTVHVFRAGLPPVLLNGLSARLVSELVAFGAPVGWQMLADELWPEGGTRKQLDMVLVRLRRKLRDERLRSDLVRADGAGIIELFLRPGDVIEDQV
jgi:hypothetical protein